MASLHQENQHSRIKANLVVVLAKKTKALAIKLVNNKTNRNQVVTINQVQQHLDQVMPRKINKAKTTKEGPQAKNEKIRTRIKTKSEITDSRKLTYESNTTNTAVSAYNSEF